jgi:hypothetical protein
MDTDTAHAHRRRQKKKLRQRKSSGRNYQVGEDVWARYPGYNNMYVASVTAVNNYKRTCTVIFNNVLTVDLSNSQLRHVTLEDIQRDRYVDYGQGWSERTDIGAINIYNQYGELQETHFTGASEDIYNDLFTDQDHNDVNDNTVNDVPSSNNTTEDKAFIFGSSNSLITEIFMVPIPDPEEPTATYCHCPVWNVSSYAEAEAKAVELINQDFDYLKAIERAKHRKETSQQYGSLHSEEVNMPQSHETLVQMEFQLTECGSQSLFTESSTMMCQSSTNLADHQPPTGNMNETEGIILSYQQGNNPELARYETSIDRSLFEVADQTNMQDLPTGKGAGTQTESSIYPSTATINPKHESIDMAYLSQPAGNVQPLTICKKRSSTWSSKYHWHIQKDISSVTTYIVNQQHTFWSRFRFNNASNYVFIQFLLSTLLIVMIICQLSTGSMINEMHVNSVPFTIRHMVLNAIPILMVTLIPFSSILNGPSRSMLELWSYPFAVP